MFRKFELIFIIAEAIVFLGLAALFGNLAMVNLMLRLQEIIAIGIGLMIAFIIIFVIKKGTNPVKYFRTAIISLLFAILIAFAAIITIDAFGRPLIAYIILWLNVIIPICINMWLDKKVNIKQKKAEKTE